MTAPTTLGLRRAIETRVRQNERMYGVVDAARALKLAYAARERDDATTSHGTLLTGPLGKYLDHVAPHLVEIDPASDYLDSWSDALGSSAGILFLAEAESPAVFAHLRKLFVVTDEDGAEYSFRYYDPRVLRLFLTSCDVAQAEEFFGPMRLVLVEAEQPATMLACSPTRTGVKLEAVTLTPA